MNDESLNDLSIDDKLIQKSTQRIENVYYNNTKFANTMRTRPVFTNDITKQTKGIEEIITGPMSAKMSLVTLPKQNIVVALNLEKTATTDAGTDLTPYDMMVLDAVCTLAQNGLTIFTPEAISRIMTGNTQKHVSEQKINRIKESIDKMRKITIKMNCTEELNARGIDPSKTIFNIEDTSYLLPIHIRTVTMANGHVKTGYILLEMPILYVYARYIKQIITVPITLLQSEKYNETEEITLIRNYLIRKIAILKNSKNKIKGNTINIQSLLADLGYSQTDYSNWAKKYKNLCDIILLIMQDFKEVQYIQDYEKIYKGGQQRKRIEGVTISL